MQDAHTAVARPSTAPVSNTNLILYITEQPRRFVLLNTEFKVKLLLAENNAPKTQVALPISIMLFEDGIEKIPLSRLFFISPEQPVIDPASGVCSVSFIPKKDQYGQGYSSKCEFRLRFFSSLYSPNINYAETRPFFVCPFRLVVIRQPHPIFYKETGGKNACFEVDIALVDSDRVPVLDREVQLRMELFYENGKRVDNQEICSYKDHRFVESINKSTGTGKFFVRIDEVSKSHQNRKFIVEFKPLDYVHDIIPTQTIPICVMSKRPKHSRSLPMSSIPVSSPTIKTELDPGILSLKKIKPGETPSRIVKPHPIANNPTLPHFTTNPSTMPIPSSTSSFQPQNKPQIHTQVPVSSSTPYHTPTFSSTFQNSPLLDRSQFQASHPPNLVPVFFPRIAADPVDDCIKDYLDVSSKVIRQLEFLESINSFSSASSHSETRDLTEKSCPFCSVTWSGNNYPKFEYKRPDHKPDCMLAKSLKLSEILSSFLNNRSKSYPNSAGLMEHSVPSFEGSASFPRFPMNNMYPIYPSYGPYSYPPPLFTPPQSIGISSFSSPASTIFSSQSV